VAGSRAAFRVQAASAAVVAAPVIQVASMYFDDQEHTTGEYVYTNRFMVDHILKQARLSVDEFTKLL